MSESSHDRVWVRSPDLAISFEAPSVVVVMVLPDGRPRVVAGSGRYLMSLVTERFTWGEILRETRATYPDAPPELEAEVAKFLGELESAGAIFEDSPARGGI